MSPASARERWRLVSSNVRHGLCVDLRSTGRIGPLTSGHRTLAASSPVSQGGHSGFRRNADGAASTSQRQLLTNSGQCLTARWRSSFTPLPVQNGHGAGLLIAKSARSRANHSPSDSSGPNSRSDAPLCYHNRQLGGATWGISGQFRRERVCWTMGVAPYVETTMCQNQADR